MQPLLSYKSTKLYITVTCGAIMKCLPCHFDIFMKSSSDICNVCNVMDFNIIFHAIMGNKLIMLTS